MSTSAKIRAKLKGDAVLIKALMTHPMETGLRKDKATGKVVPADYIKNVKCEMAGKVIMNCNWNATVSKNPYLSFLCAGNKGDEFKMTWTDNHGATGSKSAIVK